jgi:hypothetical protein
MSRIIESQCATKKITERGVKREYFLNWVDSILICLRRFHCLLSPLFLAGFFKHDISEIGDGAFFGVIRVCHDRNS